MNQPNGIEPFFEPLESLQRVLSRFDDRGVIIGGAAVSILGKARYTEDLNILKAVAHRPKDMEYIRILADKYPNLDIAHQAVDQVLCRSS